MSAIQFEWDSRELQVLRGGAVEKALGRAMRLAGNQAFKGLQRGTTDLVLRKKRLREPAITSDQATSKPRRSDALKDLTWTLWQKGQPIPVMAFPKVVIMKGARVRAIQVGFGAGNSQRIKGAFLATMASGHQGVFRRTGKKSLPIQELFSSRLPKDLGGEVLLTLADPLYRKLKASFERGLDRELGKLRRKGQV